MMLKTISVTFCAILFGLISAAHAAEIEWPQLYELVAKAPPVAGSEPADIAKDGPIVVTFFASWCPPCTDEFRHLNELVSSDDASDVGIVAINLFEDFGGKKNPERMTVFLGRTDPQFPLVTGSEEIRLAFGDIDRIPTVVVYSKSGKEVWRFVHIRDAEKTHATLEDLTAALKLAREN